MSAAAAARPSALGQALAAIAVMLGMKLVILVFAALAWPMSQDQPLYSLQQVFDNWNRWDAPHYLAIARDGYQTRGDAANFIVFLPMYPWLVRLAVWLTHNWVMAAFLVSTVASMAAAVLLQQLARLDFSPRTALDSVAALALFPTAYFLHIGYTESLFLALVLASFLAARRESWLLAGLLGVLAALTRSAGIVLVPALAAEALWQWREGRRPRLAWLCALLPSLGIALYLLINYAVTGSATTFMEIQRRHWFKQLAPPWVGLMESYRALERGASDAALLGGQELLFAMLGLTATVVALRYVRPSYVLWMAGNWLLYVGTSWVMSVPRYTLVLFPIYFLFAIAARRGRVRALLLVAGSVLLQGLFVMRFSQGYWAF